MKRLIQFALFVFLFSSLTGCNGQTKTSTPPQNNSGTKTPVGGGCDGCEIMFVGMPDKLLPVDTSVGWKEKGQKLLVKGKVYKIDGKTPAPNVIIYYWQTDNNGHYSPTPGMAKKQNYTDTSGVG